MYRALSIFASVGHLTVVGMVVVFRDSTDKPMLNKELTLLSSEYRNLETLKH